MKIKSKLWGSIGVILLGLLYSFLVFSLKKILTLSEWIVFGFTILAFLFLLVWVCVRPGTTKEYPMFDMPLSRIVIAYCTLQFFCGGILGMILPLPNEYAVLIVEVVVLGIFVLVTVFLNAHMSYIEKLDNGDYKNVSQMRELTASAEAISKLLIDPELVKQANRMVEALRYTDPSSIEETKGIERRIANNLSIIREEIDTEDIKNIESRIQAIIHLVNERAGIISALKK